jgi:hypothetical protein
MFKKIFIMAAAVFLLTGCNSDSNTSGDGKRPSEEIPTLDRSANLTGVDDNQNGIRDDIEAYIVENYSDEEQKKALFQFAKTMQASLFIDASDMISAKQVGVGMSRAITCIFSKLESQEVSDENPHIAIRKIESMTANTKTRLKAYLEFNKAMDGTASTSPRGDTCE